MPLENDKYRGYMMENHEEGKRLALKTDREAVMRQAVWAGIGPGMRVLDVGCGTGIATDVLAELVGPSGHVTGLDFSDERLKLAHENYGTDRVDFVHHDIRAPFIASEGYDAIWSRFFFEYFRKDQLSIVANSLASLKSGGIACLADLDNNSLAHCGLSARLELTLADIMARLERDFDFDPYAGRRLYGHLYRLGFQEISCTVEAHHLIYGDIQEKDQYNWLRKIEVAARNSGCSFEAYDGSFEAFHQEASEFLNDPLRFTYTPLILVRGVKSKQE